MTQILVFGPSTTYGAWDIEGGYVQRLRRWLDQKVIDSNYDEYYVVYNLGIDGDTAEGILKRLESEIKPRIEPEEETVIIVSAGINDSLFNNKTGEFKVPKKEYDFYLDKIFNAAKKFTAKVLFIGAHPINELLTDPVPWVPDCSYLKKYIKEYDDISKKVCKENKVHFIDLYSELEKTKYKENLVDGVHFNDKGQKMMFEIIKNYLTKNKIL